MPVPLILDTDLGSDIDDALALAFCVRHPEIELRAVTTVADDVARRARWTRTLLDIAGRPEIPVAQGVGWTASPSGRDSAWPHDGHGLEETDLPAVDAVELLLDNRDATIATVGMQSNIAAALDRDEAFARRVPLLAVMGGVFAPMRIGDRVFPPSYDHNLCVDPDASVRALNAGIGTLYTPIDVTVNALLRPHHVDALRQGDDFCRLIASCLDAWYPTSQMPEGVAAVMHDPLTVAVLVERSFVTSERAPVKVVRYPEGHVRTVVDPLEGEEAEIITSVDGDAFCEYWLQTVLGQPTSA